VLYCSLTTQTLFIANETNFMSDFIDNHVSLVDCNTVGILRHVSHDGSITWLVS